MKMLARDRLDTLDETVLGEVNNPHRIYEILDEIEKDLTPYERRVLAELILELDTSSNHL